MAVSAINQAHPAQQTQNTYTQPTKKEQNAAPKADTAQATEAHAPEGTATTGATAAENNAGREQGRRPNGGEQAANNDTTGNRINLYT